MSLGDLILMTRTAAETAEVVGLAVDLEGVAPTVGADGHTTDGINHFDS